MIFKLGIFISLISNIVFGLPVRELQLGSQRDIHNCVTDGGYQWCESSQECIRPWLTECPIQTNICKDSRQQLCRMLCPRPVCKSNECAMRIDTCCQYKCIDSNKNNLQINDICYRFCEENPEKNIDYRNDCPENTICSLKHTTNELSFDNCHNMIFTCNLKEH